LCPTLVVVCRELVRAGPARTTEATGELRMGDALALLGVLGCGVQDACGDDCIADREAVRTNLFGAPACGEASAGREASMSREDSAYREGSTCRASSACRACSAITGTKRCACCWLPAPPIWLDSAYARAGTMTAACGDEACGDTACASACPAEACGGHPAEARP